ncbi:SCA7-domain-containing protein [Eremomyces bilateralis CBS 781.70]|uniref:SCA7-domain-containing protein n=1 Tax=Eremomyces bilateralis CBS 781.70 TaxID=1392243 RepID=A0A6G1G400_9PEZI|nr:SCA7-domain-containing protein [Eremomyces bilateralis CBS 781.70]KAF1812549.1 SCA7-domain-containing protein [Eremomyces bilateralis CBS 781.70]
MSSGGAKKAPANTAPRYPGHGLVDPSIYDRLFTDDDKKPVKDLKIKKPAPKQTKPGNWKDTEIIEPASKKSDASRATSPFINPPDDRTLAAFPNGRPLDDTPDIVQCKHCKKPVARLFAPAHIRDCLKKKQEKQQRKKEAKEAKDAAARKEKGEDDDAGEKGKGARKSAVKANADESGAKKGKKRKADGDADKGPNSKKKKKDEPKAKVPKPKQPVDVEKQCGVILPNGAQCARSLTCKSHSMGAKRGVTGRSMPYDMLLAQYQKKNQAKQQRAAMDANAPLADEFDNQGPVDSDEEKEAVLNAFRRAHPRPIYQPAIVDMKRKYQYNRVKEMLINALGGARGSTLFNTARDDENDGGQAGVNEAASGTGSVYDSQSRRPSVGMSSGGGASRQIAPQPLAPRKASVSGAVGSHV